jgi:hypothetical protein
VFERLSWSEASLFSHVGCRGVKMLLHAWVFKRSNCGLPRVSVANRLISLWAVATRLRCELACLLRRWGCAMQMMQDAGLRKPCGLSSSRAGHRHAPASSSTLHQHPELRHRCSLSLPLVSWKLCSMRGCQAAYTLQTHHCRGDLAAQAVTIEGCG